MNQDKNIIQILPCPFCDSRKVESCKVDHPYNKGIQVHCLSCEAKGPIAKTEEQAIEAWNEAH